MQRKKGPSRYQRQMGNSRQNNTASASNDDDDSQQAAALLAAQRRRQKQVIGDQVDQRGGIELVRMQPGDPSRRGWLYHIQPSTVRTGRLCFYIVYYR
jgi:hypothetical protein